MADIAASVLAKLKNKSKKTGIGYQKCLQLFFQEEFLRRLAASRYAENFVLKGGLFIYTLTNFESRSTVDVDFLMRGLNNDLARMDEIIEEILSISTGNDFVTFKATKMEPIAIQRKYHGISTQITGYIKNVRMHFGVDIGVGDVIIVLLFMKVAILQQKSKFGYLYKFNAERMANTRIMLPVTDDGAPDYKYMEQYAKNLMLRKYKQYLAYLDSKEKMDTPTTSE